MWLLALLLGIAVVALVGGFWLGTGARSVRQKNPPITLRRRIDTRPVNPLAFGRTTRRHRR